VNTKPPAATTRNQPAIEPWRILVLLPAEQKDDTVWVVATVPDPQHVLTAEPASDWPAVEQWVRDLTGGGELQPVRGAMAWQIVDGQ
jgi:hypothetical protein